MDSLSPPLFSSEKLENSLQLALDTPEAERIASSTLNVGYNSADKTWELIVKYNNREAFLSYVEGRSITTDLLIAGYAILTIPESEISALTRQSFLEFVEQPKRLFFADQAGLSASCVPADRRFSNALPDMQMPPFPLTGKGVLIGIIDSGIDFTNPDFQNGDGTTRVLKLYDLQQRRVFTKEEIDTYLSFTENNNDLLSSLSLALDVSGHGTAVAGIAASNGRLTAGNQEEAPFAGTMAGMAPEAELLIAKLGPDIPDSFPRTTQLMKAVNWMVLTAVQMNKPLAINISIGNTYGPHDGSSLLETFLDQASQVGRCSICVGSGNEAADSGHASVYFAQNETGSKTVPLSIGVYETGLTLQCWKNYSSECSVTLIAPDGTIYPVVDNFPDTGGSFLRFLASLDKSRTITTPNEYILAYIGTPVPYSTNQELYLDFVPRKDYLTQGIWQIQIGKVVTNPLAVNLYLPVGKTRSLETLFLQPDPAVTLTIPSTASRVITVGAYSPYTDRVPAFSGRGYILEQLITASGATAPTTFFQTQVKPDLVAPGVDIVSNNLTYGYSLFTGTSFATPFVTGAAALLMEWGIIRGNDRYMYGQKIKATLQRLARQLSDYPSVPNEISGYGALCLQPK